MSPKRKSPHPRTKQPVDFPTKAELKKFIQENHGKISRREIARAFNMTADERIRLKGMLRELEADGTIEGTKGRIIQRGRIGGVMLLDITERDTDGELIARPVRWDGDGEPPRVLVVPGRLRELRPALGVGERILARVESDDEGHKVAALIKRIGSSAHDILGVLSKAPDGYRVTPVDRKSRGELHVGTADLLGAEPGDLVVCELLPDRAGGLRRARIKERVGSMAEPKSISLIAIHSHRIPVRFPEGVLRAAESAKPIGLEDRTDLRHLPLITIDPADARDHDDAVYADFDVDENNPGGFVLWVAIADVAHYVQPDSALDVEARSRGNSVYFPDRVVPMLPEALSTDLCSLMPDVDRPCMAVAMEFDAQGKMHSQKFVRGLMRSRAKLSYQQAQAAWDGTADAETQALLPEILQPLFRAYDILKQERTHRSPLDLDLPEYGIAFSDDGKVSDVYPRVRLESMRLIEECMVQANVAAALALEAKKTPLLYRAHEPPAQEKIQNFKNFVETLGLKFSLAQAAKTHDFNKLMAAAKGTDFESMLGEIVLRTQSQARYAPERLGHFGLNLKSYAHFTSPIRRYSDLIVHRALIRAYDLGDDGLRDEEIATLKETGEAISTLERRAMAAERDATDRYLAAFLTDRVGATFKGRIAGVTRFGLFVKLDETGADGIVPIRTLGNDYFIHDESTHALVGDASGATYRLGERVEVKLVEAAPITGGLVFELLSEPQTFRKTRPKKAKPGKHKPAQAKRPAKRSAKRRK